MGITLRARAALATAALVATAGLAAPGAASAAKTHGQLLRLAPGASANANQSTNWFGYVQGTLEQGSKLFNSITGDWTVPAVSQHVAGKDQSSSTWIGIGGGCIDAGCTGVSDPTLIQTGTEQDVAADGTKSYSAWFEVIPAPSLTITSMTVSAGDHMHADISEVATDSDLWNITISDVTTGSTFTQTVPYPSTHTTAEWIEETPLTFGTSGAGLAALPDLTTTSFTGATTNGASAGLKASEEMFLTDANGVVIGAPSAPNATGDGFSVCTWATSC
jgi:hypothetical protein